MMHDRMMRLSAWVALVLALVATLPARSSFAQAGNSPLPAARLEPFAYGVAAGDLTSDSVVLWTRTPGAASVRAELAASETFENLTALPTVPWYRRGPNPLPPGRGYLRSLFEDHAR